ncbi:thymidine phosphorylase family protein [Engelhardtia mirabilis]|uniref:thymidine phosphorylase n=1 Tax=Engelhardtia mirabilis TaxID=2528011 RepID=A0A518BEC5_9BACT|nr:Pyrimidine-nucleoside phosphorylase [Planctomycetes bacterium Pla133]QDU99559.1 Pyrimidine-nucleoside phosphorylase [Planctomycetes bacterium Pla86]
MSTQVAQPLRLRRVAIDTYRENVAFLHRDCPAYRTEGFQALAKVRVSSANGEGRRIVALLNIVDDASIVGTGEIGLGEQAFDQLAAVEGAECSVDHAEPPRSLDAVHRKIAGERLDYPDFRAIANDIVSNRYSKVEMAAFLVSCGQTGLEREEVLHLTRAMVETGERLDWGEALVADKHCIGGIPGNRTSMLVVPIVAAHGMLIPKTSSRAITSPAGTADTMSVLARVDLPMDEIQAIVRRERGCLAWGGTARLAPVDDFLISVERPLSIDSPGQMVASILSKKIAAGATHLLVDIPMGPSAKVRDMGAALRLRKLFEFVGDRLGLHIEVVMTDGSEPIGRGIGPVLEARDVMQVLQNDAVAPQDLRQKALRLAGRVLEFDPDVRGGQGFALARDILDSGRALSKMRDIIVAQGEVDGPPRQPGRLRQEVRSEREGVVTAIDNHQLARIARLAGAPMDLGAGVDLHKKLGDQVDAGELLYTVYADFPSDARFAEERVKQSVGYTIEAASAQVGARAGGSALTQELS